MPSYPFFCGKDCGGDACALLATVEKGRVTRIRQNPAGGEFLQGCRRGFDQPLFHNAPERLLTPLIRTGERGSGQFRPATWDEALSLTADRLYEIREKFGPSAVLNLSSAGDTGALHCTYLLLPRFLNLFGGPTHLTGSYSTGAASFLLPYLFGRDLGRSGFDPETMEQAEMIVLWGANLLETRMGAPVYHHLSRARARGIPIVVIDPRRSATVKSAATWWIPVRPGTDAALMLAVLHVLFTEGLYRREPAAAYSLGMDDLERYVLGLDGGQPRTPDWAAAICGVPAGEITRFARAYAAASPAMLLPGYSIQRVYAGEEPIRLAVALQLATGNFGRLGGSTGSLNNLLPGLRVGRLPVPPAPPQPVVPQLRWPDLVLEGRAGGYPADIHAIYCLGSNLANQGADVRKSAAAFQKVDFAVCHDLFLTPTARLCDVVFPAASAFEKEDIGIPWHGNYLLYRPQIVPPAGQARSDYDALCDLAGRLGFGAAFSEGRSAAEWVQLFLDQSEIPDHEAFRQSGVYRVDRPPRAGLDAFTADPAGHPLDTPSGKVEIYSARFAINTGLSPIPTWMEPPADPRFPLRQITPKSPHRTHSQGHLSELRRRAGHALEMHPADAAPRGFKGGETVRVHNAQGAVIVPLRLSEDVVPGVVCLPEGIWADLDGDGEDRAGAANLLTSTQGTPAGKAPVMHGVGVEVGLFQTIESPEGENPHRR